MLLLHAKAGGQTAEQQAAAYSGTAYITTHHKLLGMHILLEAAV
jgi:hypothetical protein